MGFFSSTIRLGKIKRISSILGSQQPLTVYDLGNKTSPREDALNELIEMVKSEHAEILRKYNAGEAEIKNIYNYLIESGAGQWAGEGMYVPVGALLKPIPLVYLLDQFANDFHGLPKEDRFSKAINVASYFSTGDKSQLV